MPNKNKTYNDFNKMLATKLAIKRDQHKLKPGQKPNKPPKIRTKTTTQYYKDPKTGKMKTRIVRHEAVEESDAPQTTVGSVGGGMIGEPPGPTKRKKRKKKYEVFAGSNVFEVSSDVFMKCKGEKGRYDRYVKHVGNDRVGEGIRSYGRENPGKGIIIKDSVRGTMMILRRGKK